MAITAPPDQNQYITILLRYPPEAETPRFGAGDTAFGGAVVAVSFTDMFAEMEALRARLEDDGLADKHTTVAAYRAALREGL